MKTIGVVCEGDRDYDMIRNTIMLFMEQEYAFLWLQPHPVLGKDFGNGWKGVWKWCETHSGRISQYMNDVSPKMDLLVVQMDGDVARCEREVYCRSVDIQCIGQESEHPLNCSIAKAGGCAQALPPNPACDGSVTARVTYLKNLLSALLNDTGASPILITIPCDSTDTWIIAAYDASQKEPESIDDPWKIITHSKDYFGVRIPSGKKSRRPYSALIEQVCKNWEQVKALCPQAKAFEEKIRQYISD